MRYLLCLAALAAGCGRPEMPWLPPLSPIPALAPALPAARDAITDYARRAIAICDPAKLSPLVREALAQDVGVVAAATFPVAAEAEAFVALLCIESAYDQAARSPAGAVGVAQVMPAYAAEFATECGAPFSAGKAVPSDVGVQAVNLRLGACHFRHLLEVTGGNIPLALASYNAGASSKTAAKLKAGATGAAETSGYLARHYVLTEQLRGGKDGDPISH